MDSSCEPTYKITADLAFITGEWADGLELALLEHQPKRMSLTGDWNDLGRFTGLVDSVESLKIAGSIENGRIKSIQGIEVFRNLRKLEMVSPVKSGYDASGLRRLESIRVAWQADVLHLLTLPGLSEADISAYPHPNLRDFPERCSLQRLRLGQPSLVTLDGISNLKHLREFDLARARKLTSLQGIEGTTLNKLDINEARQLADIRSLEKTSIESLKLLHVSSAIDLSPLTRIRSLRRLHVAGKGVPVLPWIDLLGMEKLAWVAGLWDPALAPEGALESALPQGRQFSRFEPAAAMGVRALWIESHAVA